MAKVNFWFLTFVLAAWLAMATSWDLSTSPTPSPLQSPSISPAPSEDCSTLIYNMVDCVTYLMVGSKDTEPDPSCCAGLKEVVAVDAECICEALRSSIDLGFAIDMNRTLSLPSACSLSVPDLSTCDPNPSPWDSPVPAPAPAPVSPTAPAPGSSGGGGPSEAPASSPVNSGQSYSSAVDSSLVALVFLLYLGLKRAGC